MYFFNYRQHLFIYLVCLGKQVITCLKYHLLRDGVWWLEQSLNMKMEDESRREMAFQRLTMSRRFWEGWESDESSLHLCCSGRVLSVSRRFCHLAKNSDFLIMGFQWPSDESLVWAKTHAVVRILDVYTFLGLFSCNYFNLISNLREGYYINPSRI